MIGVITGAKVAPSKSGGVFYYMFFKVDGQSLRSSLYPKLENFKRWEGFLQRALEGEKIAVDNLTLKGKMVDADSFPREIAKEK